MLECIQLTHFKKHENLTVDFAPGLNAVKAENEGGKSTLLQAIAYALFGTRALPDSLEETVTWGKPVNSLRVTLTFSVGGVRHEITRSKGGAELVHPGGTVTGQAETSKFIAELLGADVHLATKLLIAHQGDVQGSLAGGSKNASDLIQQLANFTQIDELIELLQVHLVTGSTASLKARLEHAEQVLASKEVEPLDVQGLRAEAEKLRQDAQEKEGAVRTAATQAQQASRAYSDALKAQAAHQAAQTRVQEREQALSQVQEAEPEKPPAERLDTRQEEAELNEARRRVQEAELVDSMHAYNASLDKQWGAVGDKDNARFEGPRAEAEAAFAAAQAQASRSRNEVADHRVEIAQLEATLLHGSCTACGRDLSDVPEVQQRNERTQRQIEALVQKRDAAARQVELSKEEAELLSQVLGVSVPGELARSPCIKPLDSTVPANLVWVAGEPKPLAQAQADLERAKEALAQKQRLAAQQDLLHRQYAEWESRLEKAQHALQAARKELESVTLPEESVDALSERAEHARKAHEAALALFEAARTQHTEFERDAAQRIAEHESALREREQAEKDVATCQADFKQLEFNNALLKAVREAKPVVTSRLWSLVLCAVSSYFSDMRGIPSDVTRSAAGFLVDGHPVSSLSGSTKDALGLAIRVALLRTFLPGLSLLILDEPNAAMDDERTSQVLGFIAASGFNQTLVVSHDDLTPSVADHIITLH